MLFDGFTPAGKKSFGGVMGTSIVRFNNITAASTGLNSRQADAEGIEYEVTLIHAMNHAGYYPRCRAHGREDAPQEIHGPGNRRAGGWA